MFVFADGAFAGTVAPAPTNFQTDGSAQTVQLTGAVVTATFQGYPPTDAPCCPSRPDVLVGYVVERGPSGPLLVPTYRADVTR